MDPTELASVPVAQDQREQPWAQLGIDYEARVVSRLARQASTLCPPTGEILPERLGIRFLRGEGEQEYACQIAIRPTGRPDFLGPAGDVELRQSIPDVVRRVQSGQSESLRIIDIKATRTARAFHKTQVAFYALVLRQRLAEIGSSQKVDSVGEIWRIPDDSSAESDEWVTEEFALAPYIRVVEDFCTTTLPKITQARVDSEYDDTFFHVYFKCEQCKYLPHCIGSVSLERRPETRDISAVAGLSHESKRTLAANGVRTVATLASLGDGIGRIDGAGWSLARRAEVLSVRARALREDTILDGPVPHTFLMPPRTDVAVYLLADNDSVDDTLVTLGYRIVDADGVRETTEILPTAERNAEADALVRVFGQLISDLEKIDGHNASLADDDPNALYAHIFVYEPSEAVSIQNAVRRHLDDPRIRGGLLDLVRLFPPEEIVPEPEFRGMQHLPATALRSVLEQLLALPVTVSYDLRQVSEAMFREGHLATRYAPEAPFERPFSSLLALDVSRDLREGRRGEVTVDAVRDDVRARLAAIDKVSAWLRDEHQRRVGQGDQPMLRLAKKPFRLQSTFDPLAAGDLDILRAFELLENRAGLLDTLVRLAQPKRVRRDAGRSIGPMQLWDINEHGQYVYLKFRVPRACEDTDIAAGAMGLILTDGEPDLILEPSVWRNVGCDLMGRQPSDRRDVIRARMHIGSFNSDAFKDVRARAGKDDWWLDTSFVDFNSDRAARFLSFLGGKGGA